MNAAVGDVLTRDERAALARAIETTVGLGCVPIMGCDLCKGRDSACPVHVGVAAGMSTWRIIEAIVARHTQAAVVTALTDAAAVIESPPFEHHAVRVYESDHPDAAADHWVWTCGDCFHAGSASESGARRQAALHESLLMPVPAARIVRSLIPTPPPAEFESG